MFITTLGTLSKKENKYYISMHRRRSSSNKRTPGRNYFKWTCTDGSTGGGGELCQPKTGSQVSWFNALENSYTLSMICLFVISSSFPFSFPFKLTKQRSWRVSGIRCCIRGGRSMTACRNGEEGRFFALAMRKTRQLQDINKRRVGRGESRAAVRKNKEYTEDQDRGRLRKA